MTRQSRTSADRAQAALDVACRRLERVQAKVTLFAGELEAARLDHVRALADVEYLLKSPHLQQSVSGASPSAPVHGTVVHSTGIATGAKVTRTQGGAVAS